MKKKLQTTLTVLSGVILTCLPAGCPMPTKEGIARNTTEYNLVAEKAGNEMLLLNIVRASKRRPMYFTSFGKLTGNLTFEVGTGSINIPFGSIGDGLNGSNSIAPNAGYKNSPLFDVAVLDTQEFTRGIMTPVSMKMIEYYWSQGWPKEILLHLFIRRIEIENPNAPNGKDVYINYPENRKRFDDFQEQIRTQKWKWDIEEVDATSIGEVDANEASKLKNLIEVQKAGLRLRPGKEKNKKELCLSQVKYVFSRVKRVPRNSPGNKENNIVVQTFSPDAPSEFRVHLRSPEAILYYLGEIMRVENKEDPNIPMVNVSNIPSVVHPAQLFYARKATDKDKAPCVSVDYEGVRYVIPGECPDSDDGSCVDRSMHVLSLVSQLIGLQKTSEEVPATGVVSVVGR